MKRNFTEFFKTKLAEDFVSDRGQQDVSVDGGGDVEDGRFLFLQHVRHHAHVPAPAQHQPRIPTNAATRTGKPLPSYIPFGKFFENCLGKKIY